MAPINHFAPNKVSNVSFVLANIMMDWESIIFALTGVGAISHASHEPVYMLVWTTIIAICGIRSMKWVLGSYLGGFTHLILDGMVHPDIEPFRGFIQGNPFYMGWMEPLSLVLLPFMVWFIVKNVGYFLQWVFGVKTNLAARFRPTRLDG